MNASYAMLPLVGGLLLLGACGNQAPVAATSTVQPTAAVVQSSPVRPAISVADRLVGKICRTEIETRITSTAPEILKTTWLEFGPGGHVNLSQVEGKNLSPTPPQGADSYGQQVAVYEKGSAVGVVLPSGRSTLVISMNPDGQLVGSSTGNPTVKFSCE